MNYFGVSIVICTYNGRSRLPQTLGKIELLKADFPWELILVDNASTDDSAEITYNWSLKTGKHVSLRLIKEEAAGLNHARLAGWKSSQYDAILFCDDDNWLSEDFILLGARLMYENLKIGILGSFGRPVFEGFKPEWFETYAHSYAVGSLGKESGKQPIGAYHYGAACFFRKKALDHLIKLGFQSLLSDRKGNSLSSGGDVELCQVIQLLGYELHYDKRLVFEHFIEAHRLNWSYYLRLKQGISSSFPLLESYKITEFQDKAAFESHLLQGLFTNLKGLMKSGFFYFLFGQRDYQVAFMVTKTKVLAFFRNYRRTVEAFQINKECFES